MFRSNKVKGFCLVVLTLIASNASYGAASANVLAARLASRIGTYVAPSDVQRMAAAIQSELSGTPGGFLQAAAIATGTAGYADTFLFNLMAPICSLDNNPNVPQNPCIATLQYIAYSGKPWTDALTGNYVAVFTSPTGVTLPAPSLGNWLPTTTTDNWTAAYNAYQTGKMSYVAQMNMVTQASLYPAGTTAPTDTAGILTIPRASYDSANAGTNRRFVEFLFQNMLASPLQAIRDGSFGSSAAFDGIRKDVQALAPDATTLTQTCATCHGGIDRMAAAFNFMDYTMSKTTNALAQGTTLVAKLASRETTYASFPGYVESMNSPRLNSWQINYKRSPYGTYAWGATSGTGVNALAVSAVATQEFRISIINNIWTLACGQAPTPSEVPTVMQLANQMHVLYQDQVTPMVQQVAVLPECLGR